MAQTQKDLHVGICGAGIGGLACSIALARGGARVTVLEAAEQLGEIGAGIQMTPNVARLLEKWGVAEIIGENLVEFEELSLRRRDGTKVGHSRIIPNVRRDLGHPWWVVHRAHLHEGLLKVAEKLGVKVYIDSRVEEIDYQSSSQVICITQKGNSYIFDLLIGSDGAKSIVRRTLFPNVRPTPPTGNCAYRAIVPYSQIRKDPVAKELIQKLTMEVWMSDACYIITYPISAGEMFNIVLSHHVDPPVDEVQDINISELKKQYKNFDPRITRILDMIPEAQRWPLLVTGPLESWSSPQKNVVLIGDAAHSMVNHMAQGAATSMEDGAFLGLCLREVVREKMSITDAVSIYEKVRMPRAHAKQQVSFLNGEIWHLPDGPLQEARDKAMEPEMRGESFLRSANLYGDPVTVWDVCGYDAEADADRAIEAFHAGRGEDVMDSTSKTTKATEDKLLNWFLPAGLRKYGPRISQSKIRSML